MVGLVRSLGDYGLTGLVVWSLGGCGLMHGLRGVGLARWCSGGVVWLDRVAMGSLASIWNLGGCGLTRSGGYGLMPRSRGVGLVRWCDSGVVWLDRAVVGSLAFGQVCVVAWGFAVV